MKNVALTMSVQVEEFFFMAYAEKVADRNVWYVVFFGKKTSVGVFNYPEDRVGTMFMVICKASMLLWLVVLKTKKVSVVRLVLSFFAEVFCLLFAVNSRFIMYCFSAFVEQNHSIVPFFFTVTSCQ